MKQQSQRFDRNERSDRNSRDMSSSRRQERSGSQREEERSYGDYPASHDYYSDMRDFSSNGREQRDFSGSTYGSYGRDEERYGRNAGAERGDRSERQGRSDEYGSDRYSTSSDRYDRYDRSDRSDRFMTDSDRYNQRYGQGSEAFSTSGRDIEGGGYGSSSSSSRSLSSDRSGSLRGDSRGETRGRFEGRGPKGFKRSDDRIKEEVCELLTRDPSVDASDIDVEVKDGEVTLTGTVSDRRMKHLAEDCVERSFGVRDVVNQIRVKRDSASITTDALEISGRSSSSATSANPSSGTKRASSTSSLS